MQLSRPEDCLSDLTLDAWSSGELDTPARERAEAHATTCERCQTRRSRLQAERAQFFAAAPSFDAHRARFVPSRPVRRTGRTRYVFAGVFATLAAAAALLVLPASPDTRLKGGPSLGFFVKRAGKVFAGDKHSTVQPGDLIRFTYTIERSRYLVLFGQDSEAVNVYYPPGPHAARVPRGKDMALDFSVELDALLGEERIVGLFCVEEIAIAPVLSALRESGKLTVPESCQQAAITLRKVAVP